MRGRRYRYFVGDFETTVYDGQESTEVWASASVELFTEDVKIFHSIEEQLDYFVSLKSNVVCYYHNLKFDGAFWMSYLLVTLGWEQATQKTGPSVNDIEFLPPKDMKNKTFSYSISNMGQWYRMTLKVNNKIIEFRDSLKLLPFSVKKIGDGFKTKHRKLEMKYEGLRYAGCEITDKEKEYIANDVLVVKEAIEVMFNEGHKKLTIGSCCLNEYKQIIGHNAYTEYFPNLYKIEIDKNTYGSTNAGDYIRKSYRGGWCCLVKGKENQIKRNGTTADVNSLYPSMMSSESNSRYPIGEPTFWSGDYTPEEALDPMAYYFIRVKTRFYIRPGKLPFIQVKTSLMYKANENLETSDIYNHKDGKYYDKYYDQHGNLTDARVELTLTMTEWELLKEHYELVDCEILDGCYFNSAVGIFDEYIDKYKKIKMENKGALRELAKLFLNNLYGKMASNTNSSFKVAYIKEGNIIGFYTVEANDKEPGYIAVGSAITGYTRNFTIRAAQKNYHGVDNPGFIYSDTDSIHCDLKPDDLIGIKEHPTNFCCWKLESCWDEAIFVRQKTYIEHIIAENREECEPYYSVKCAGMPNSCKRLFLESMGVSSFTEEELNELKEDKLEFISQKRTLTDFKLGLTVPGKLLPKRIPGGVLLTETTYKMR